LVAVVGGLFLPALIYGRYDFDRQLSPFGGLMVMAASVAGVWIVFSLIFRRR
jgi:hypothetical protein